MICAALGCTFPVSVKDVQIEGELLVTRLGCLNGHDRFESCRDPAAAPERPFMESHGQGRYPRCQGCSSRKSGPGGSLCHDCREKRRMQRALRPFRHELRTS